MGGVDLGRVAGEDFPVPVSLALPLPISLALPLSLSLPPLSLLAVPLPQPGRAQHGGVLLRGLLLRLQRRVRRRRLRRRVVEAALQAVVVVRVVVERPVGSRQPAARRGPCNTRQKGASSRRRYNGTMASEASCTAPMEQRLAAPAPLRLPPRRCCLRSGAPDHRAIGYPLRSCARSPRYCLPPRRQAERRQGHAPVY